MTWKPRLVSAGLAYVLALVGFYPFLVVHFLRHHGEAWATAILGASIGEHTLQALLFAVPFLAVGLLGHRRVLGLQAGRAIVMPTLLAMGLSSLVVAFGPPESLAVGFLATLIGFGGGLLLFPPGPTPSGARPPSPARPA